ncbi:hypothetical protein Indivirus_1_158 [Indivirus ILV1]|uniref:Uncharacterized protein n=1 Tax=Indivirus ILV1 TaxID=1977633 RepID=A0A1V0SCU9_9VIRU|nr:hypothetical protein Indivirus_1_158 [Indivirus ILV1]
MSCNSYDKCYQEQLNNMAYPIDNESLYADRNYDKQVAHSKCYSLGPISIIEGFGGSWNMIIQILILILLIYLVYELSKDFIGKKTQLGGIIDTPSQLLLTEYKL